MDEPTQPEWMTIAETALLLNVSKSTIRRMLADGEIPHVRVRQRSIRIARQQWEPKCDCSCHDDAHLL
jgi:excisionase family DNA binding protein